MKIKWKTIAPLIVWLVIYLLPVPAGLNANQWHYFAVFAAVITGLVLESMPVGAVGLIGLTVAVVMGYVDPDPNKSLRWGLSGFSDSTVWLIVGAFVFSIGYRKSGLGKRIALLLVRALGRRTLGLGYAVAFRDLILAPATPSNTARSGGTIYPIVSNIPKIYGSEPGPTAGKIGTYVMWTAFAATAVTSSMFLTALAPNAAALSIAKKTVGVDMAWSQWFIGFAPLGVLLILLVPLVSYLDVPARDQGKPRDRRLGSGRAEGHGPAVTQRVGDDRAGDRGDVPVDHRLESEHQAARTSAPTTSTRRRWCSSSSRCCCSQGLSSLSTSLPRRAPGKCSSTSPRSLPWPPA